ncbi:MAG: hypothetical protein RLO52_23200 [Sandaracinaceae bacterium]
MDHGKVYTRGGSYRARAEARQREYRATVLGAGAGRYGHLLDESAAGEGRNFVVEAAHQAALERRAAGKGVAARTFENMLSSQAMCFNVFAPLANEPPLAASALRPFFPGLQTIESIEIEHTPADDIFNDQSGRGGVDCDVLIEARDADGAPWTIVMETKFVEPEFSICGFRKAGRAKRGKVTCPDDVPVRGDRTACLYTSRKGYRYWLRSDEYDLLRDDALPEAGCPFAGARWQLWVNLSLAHAEARARGGGRASFAVCAPERNRKLLGGQELERFRQLLRDPDSVVFVDLDQLLARLTEVAEGAAPEWVAALRHRYAGI